MPFFLGVSLRVLLALISQASHLGLAIDKVLAPLDKIEVSNMKEAIGSSRSTSLA